MDPLTTLAGGAWTVIKGTVTSLASKALTFIALASVKLFQKSFPYTRSIYVRELRAALSSMPFIYVDLPLDVQSAFADVELTSQARESLETGEWSTTRGRGAFATLRDNRKFLLLGEAGIGKTTLFRYGILTLLSKDRRRLMLYPGERPLIPIYVPLKALDVTRRFPIISYIQNSHAYFAGRFGLRRLIGLARKTRLMLFLDGYDEVSTAAGLPHIKEELNLLFSQSIPNTERLLMYQAYLPFYRAFIGNRIGMSCRREFFLANPITLPSGVALLTSLGLWDSRIELVRHIFDRYRRNESEYYKERLSEEDFMKELTVTADGSLERLSHNPLFLTVMCYIFVNDIREQRGSSEIWRRGELELIDRCADLLLVDLDKFKARGLPESERKSIVGRRGAFAPEKKAFLGKLAAHAIFEDQGVFTYEYLIEQAKQFFSLSSNQDSLYILRGLSSDDATANIVLQIVFSGVLVLVPGSKSRLFDFPHRRFREVLAADYLNSKAGMYQVCTNITKPYLFDFVVVYARRISNATPLIETLMIALSSEANRPRLGQLFLHLLSLVEDKDQKSEFVWLLILQISISSLGKTLPSGLLRLLQPNVEYQKKLQGLLDQAERDKDSSLLALASGPYQYLSRTFTSQEIESSLGLFREPVGMAAALLGESSFDGGRFEEALSRFWPHRKLSEIDSKGAAELMKLISTQKSPSRRMAIRSVLSTFFHPNNTKGRGAMDITDIEVELQALTRSEPTQLAREDAKSSPVADFSWI